MDGEILALFGIMAFVYVMSYICGFIRNRKEKNTK